MDKLATPVGVIQPPSKSAFIREARVVGNIASMIWPLAKAHLKPVKKRNKSPIIVLPGFASDDRYTWPLRRYLQCNGFTAEGWGLGVNLAGTNFEHSLSDLSARWHAPEKTPYRGEASVPYLCDQMVTRVQERADQFGAPVTLIGWSLGGYVAREVARELPEQVNKVITLGSPTIGGPKYTAAAKFFLEKGMDLDWIEAEILKQERRPITQPITAYFSKSDAVVAWQAAIDHHSPNVKHVELEACHLGMGFNQHIWRRVVEELAN